MIVKRNNDGSITIRDVVWGEWVRATYYNISIEEATKAFLVLIKGRRN